MKRDAGQVLTLVAVALPVFLALLLLAIDGGRLLLAHERLRNAAQLAAEAGASLAGDGPAPTTAAVKAIVDETLRRNLGTAFTSTVTTPGQPTNPAFNVKVAVTQPFVASVQRIGFTIGAEAAAQLGQPPASTPGTATPTPYVPPCFQADIDILPYPTGSAREYVGGNAATAITATLGSSGPSSATAPRPIYVRPGDTVYWKVVSQFAYYGTATSNGSFTVPSGAVAAPWTESSFSAGQPGIRGKATYGQFAACP